WASARGCFRQVERDGLRSRFANPYVGPSAPDGSRRMFTVTAQCRGHQPDPNPTPTRETNDMTTDKDKDDFLHKGLGELKALRTELEKAVKTASEDAKEGWKKIQPHLQEAEKLASTKAS